jgi:acyl-CoA thioester hydrolase
MYPTGPQSPRMASRYLHRRRILFHETDLAGIVHFSNYYKYMEEAEHAFLRSVGLSIHPEENWRSPLRHGWPRVRATCDFHVPLQFEEEIEIELQVADVGRKSIRYRFFMWKQPDGVRVRAATGEVVVVSVLADRAAGTIQSSPLPEEFREKLQVHPPPDGADAGGTESTSATRPT